MMSWLLGLSLLASALALDASACSAAVTMPAADRPATATELPTIRTQVDSVGFATSSQDMAAVIAACRQREGDAVAARRRELGLAPDAPWIAAVMPHDDYVYAGPVYLHLLPGLRASRWVLIGVCHACRRLGVRDRLLLESYDAWQMAGEQIPVDADLRAALLSRLPAEDVLVSNERHGAEHSLEALLPWLREASPGATFVPVLVPGMSWDRLQELAGKLADALTSICRERGWTPGRDLAILISTDAVHYGCEGWGPEGGHHPFGCDEAGHAAAVARDRMLAEATLAGRLTDTGLERFTELVWDPTRPEYPYRITWCGLYSIPLGLATATRWMEAMELPPLQGYLLRYGDSVSDGRLPVDGTRLGVTAPNTLAHWVGYAGLGYLPARTP
jgi:AmmeMemoRadiSam system protein B